MPQLLGILIMKLRMFILETREIGKNSENCTDSILRHRSQTMQTLSENAPAAGLTEHYNQVHLSIALITASPTHLVLAVHSPFQLHLMRPHVPRWGRDQVSCMPHSTIVLDGSPNSCAKDNRFCVKNRSLLIGFV